MQPNFLATFALASYPLVVLVFFVMYRPTVATALSLLVGDMFLPPGYSLPLATPTWLSKTAIPPLATLLVAWLFHRRARFRNTRALRGVELPFLLSVGAIYLTVATNHEPLHYGPVTLPGEKFSDFTSDVLRSTLVPWASFYLGRIMFRSSRDVVLLARMLVVAALVYTLPILVELRLSPQLNRWIFGYAPFLNFNQTIRWGGYRPVVFMGHGLTLSLFMLISTVMAAAMARARLTLANLPVRPLYWYLAIVLVLCKSTGSIVYALVLLPLVAFASPKRFLSLATLLALTVLLYPLLRFGDIIPTQRIAAFFTSLSPERGQSLAYRFDMEQSMMTLTQKRPWFGWGGYGRNFVYDPETGQRLTVVDGMVIAELSSRGLAGFLTGFGPYLLSILRASRRVRLIRNREVRILMAALTLCGGVIMFDLIVNATLPPMFIMMLGALNGLAPGILAEEREGERQRERDDRGERTQNWAEEGSLDNGFQARSFAGDPRPSHGADRSPAETAMGPTSWPPRPSSTHAPT